MTKYDVDILWLTVSVYELFERPSYCLQLTILLFSDDFVFVFADDCSEASAQMQNGLYMEQQKKAKAKRGQFEKWTLNKLVSG